MSLPSEDNGFWFVLEEDGGVVGLGRLGLEFGGQDEARFEVSDVIFTLLDKSADGYSQINFFFCNNKLISINNCQFKNNLVVQRR